MPGELTLVLGGERSGKSDFALELLGELPKPHALVVTGKARDASFRRRIAKHRAERPPELAVLEVAGPDLPSVLAAAGSRYGGLLVDSLDFFIFSCQGGEDDATNRLLACLDSWAGCSVVLVSCEVGLGPVAAGAETRAFVRNLGGLNRAVAARCSQAYLVCAGLPVTLKAP